MSYQVKVSDAGVVFFHVHPPLNAPRNLQWKLRWPGVIENVQCQNCVVDALDDGIATVLADGTGTDFVVSALVATLSKHVSIV